MNLGGKDSENACYPNVYTSEQYILKKKKESLETTPGLFLYQDSIT